MTKSAHFRTTSSPKRIVKVDVRFKSTPAQFLSRRLNMRYTKLANFKYQRKFRQA